MVDSCRLVDRGIGAGRSRREPCSPPLCNVTSRHYLQPECAVGAPLSRRLVQRQVA